MIAEHLQTVLKNAQAKADKDGFSVLPEGTTLTLYLCHGGVGLTVNRIDAVRAQGSLIEARSSVGKRETYSVHATDLFALSLEGSPGAPPKRAGFG